MLVLENKKGIIYLKQNMDTCPLPFSSALGLNLKNRICNFSLELHCIVLRIVQKIQSTSDCLKRLWN